MGKSYLATKINILWFLKGVVQPGRGRCSTVIIFITLEKDVGANRLKNVKYLESYVASLSGIS